MSMWGHEVRLFHLDLYRLETEEQIAVLGLDEMAGYDEFAGAGGVGRALRERGEDAAGEIYMEHGEGDERGLIVRVKE